MACICSSLIRTTARPSKQRVDPETQAPLSCPHHCRQLRIQRVFRHAGPRRQLVGRNAGAPPDRSTPPRTRSHQICPGAALQRYAIEISSPSATREKRLAPFGGCSGRARAVRLRPAAGFVPTVVLSEERSRHLASSSSPPHKRARLQRDWRTRHGLSAQCHYLEPIRYT